jgi:zinc protease
LFPYFPPTVDPALATVAARVKKLDDAVYVRDEIIRTFAHATAEPIPVRRLADAKSNARYSLIRSLDNTEEIAGILARYVRFNRSYNTLGQLYQVYEALSPEDLQATAQQCFTDDRLVVTTLSKEPLPEAMAKAPSISQLASRQPGVEPEFQWVLQKSQLPQINLKLLFRVGSANDPPDKEGLAALTAAMVAEAGSKELRIDEINNALYPMAGAFRSQTDKEMTTFTGSIHRDNWQRFSDIVLPMLLNPGFRAEDFKRLKEKQLNTLKEDLRSNNEEELGKERLQANIFSGTAYGHPVLGTIAGIESITLEDVKDFWRKAYARANLTIGLAGDAPDEFRTFLRKNLGQLPTESGLPALQPVKGRSPEGYEVEITEKDARATAISFGHPIEVTRAHPDYPALLVARAWLGEHRSSMSHLYQKIRELRGMNYGDYAYIEAFPRGMFQFFPDPNVARRAQIFEVWIRPVVPENAHMAIRIALHELQDLIEKGISQEDFETVREYLAKNVYVMTATQDQRLGYALDSKWYGIGEYTSYMHEQLRKLTLEDINRAIRKHLSFTNLYFVIITKDAQGLKQRLVADEFSPIKYDAEKPPAVLEEDRRIGNRRLNIKAAKVRITPVAQVFAE